MGHKSGQCKEPGCNKDQWKDGYCRNCAQYALQKTTMINLNSTTKLLLEVAKGLERIEKNINSLNIDNKFNKEIVNEQIDNKLPNKIVPHIEKKTKPVSRKISKKPSSDIPDVGFIPTVRNNIAIPNIKGIKKSTIDKDAVKINKKLSTSKDGG